MSRTWGKSLFEHRPILKVDRWGDRSCKFLHDVHKILPLRPSQYVQNMITDYSYKLYTWTGISSLSDCATSGEAVCIFRLWKCSVVERRLCSVVFAHNFQWSQTSKMPFCQFFTMWLAMRLLPSIELVYLTRKTANKYVYLASFRMDKTRKTHLKKTTHSIVCQAPRFSDVSDFADQQLLLVEGFSVASEAVLPSKPSTRFL